MRLPYLEASQTVSVGPVPLKVEDVSPVASTEKNRHREPFEQRLKTTVQAPSEWNSLACAVMPFSSSAPYLAIEKEKGEPG